MPTYIKNSSAALAIAAVSLIVGVLFWDTTKYLSGIGAQTDSELVGGFAICSFFLLLGLDSKRLQAVPRKPASIAALFILLMGLTWLIGQWLAVRLGTQVGLLGILLSVWWFLFGAATVRAVLYPFAFLVLAVPFLDLAIPYLVKGTAWFVHFALQLSMIDVHRDGAYFVVPSGSWSIADSCSGVAYLRACLILGILFAWALFDHAQKRARFLLGILLIGICGNWLRAWLTIAIAHWTGNSWLRESHGTFGWIFYFFLLTIYVSSAWRFRDPAREPEMAVQSPTSIAPIPQPIRAVIAIVLVAMWPVLHQLDHARDTPVTNAIEVADSQGWHSRDIRATDWQPDVTNARNTYSRVYRKHDDQVVLFVAEFHDSSWNSKLVSSIHQLSEQENPKWTLASRGGRTIDFPSGKRHVETGIVIGRGKRLTGWRWYWVNSEVTASGFRARMNQLAQRVEHGGDFGAWVAIATDAPADSAEGLLQEFVREMWPQIENTLSRRQSLHFVGRR